MPTIFPGRVPIEGDFCLSYTLYTPRSTQRGQTPLTLVVFVNGLRTLAADWDGIATELHSNHSLYLLTFDRWNSGESDELPSTRSTNDMTTAAEDLSLLLAGVASEHKIDLNETRLILVGSSIGCCIARIFVTSFHKPALGSIHGIILLDSYISNTDFVSLFPPPKAGEPSELKKTREIITKLFHPSVPNPEGLDRSNAPTLLPYADKPKLPGSPDLIVVAHDPEYNVEEMVEKLGIDKDYYLEYVQSAWDEYNKGLEMLSNSSRFLIAENSAHFIYKDRPDLVVHEIDKITRR
ncbi:hypothetical protein M422DRAFT_69358 [Sphaerobolus stellatus SS14]|uniref:AB hydrolase-1 domain-containing protein n=1 Tax=Sphaerobolus stellatus (strain SS14) TaxID=990650 RepID=A0A0C9VIR3_SPHS4|nr:hypothetical protein M422DRAFT_69358 [Sphaerobolus stellatus SS14]